jgi:hypothetical protein
MEVFDLVSIQRQATESKSPRALFDLWEQVCRKYDRGQIGKYHLQELKDIIWPKLRILNAIRKGIDDCYVPPTARSKTQGKKKEVPTLAL